MYICLTVNFRIRKEIKKIKRRELNIRAFLVISMSNMGKQLIKQLFRKESLIKKQFSRVKMGSCRINKCIIRHKILQRKAAKIFIKNEKKKKYV